MDPIKNSRNRNPRSGDFEFVRASNVKTTRIDWLWEPYLPLGKLTILSGRAGVGKGTFLAHLAARVTHGELPGALSGTPADAVFICGEDGFADTIVPRCIAAGADRSRVYALRSQRRHTYFEVAKEPLRDLGELVGASDAKFVVIDPLADYLPGGVDEWKQSAMRKQVLGHLGDFAEQHDIALVTVQHFSKKQEGSFSDRLSGSHANHDYVRSALLISHDPGDDADDASRALTSQKHNLSAPPPALRFQIVSKRVKLDGNLGTVEHPCAVQFERADDIKKDDVLGAASSNRSSSLKAATDLIRHLLADGEWHPRKDVHEAVEKATSKTTAIRAAKELELQREKRGFPSVAYWRLPVDPSGSNGAGSTATGSTDEFGSRKPTTGVLRPSRSKPPSVERDRGSTGRRSPFPRRNEADK